MDNAVPEVKSRATFQVDGKLLSGEAREYELRLPFRDPAALEILQKIASELRVRHYRATEPKHGKASDACMLCTFDNSAIFVSLMVEERESELIELRLSTRIIRKQRWARIFLKRPTIDADISQKWARLCSAIDEHLRGLGATQMVWRTKGEEMALHQRNRQGSGILKLR